MSDVEADVIGDLVQNLFDYVLGTATVLPPRFLPWLSTLRRLI